MTTTTENFSQEARDLFPKGLKHVRRDLDPTEAIHLVKKLKRGGAALFVRLDIPLGTDWDDSGTRQRFYDVPDTLKITLAQAVRCLQDKVEFNAIKSTRGQATGKVKISRHGNCCFIGG